jgi:hypothetical protein
MPRQSTSGSARPTRDGDFDQGFGMFLPENAEQ